MAEDKQNISGTLAQGWLLHRAPFRDTWKRSWATLSIPQKHGLQLPVLTLQTCENGHMIASLPLHRNCSISPVCAEFAPALIGSPEQCPFETPLSLLPQECYFAFNVVWPQASSDKNEETSFSNTTSSVVIIEDYVKRKGYIAKLGTSSFQNFNHAYSLKSILLSFDLLKVVILLSIAALCYEVNIQFSQLPVGVVADNDVDELFSYSMFAKQCAILLFLLFLIISLSLSYYFTFINATTKVVSSHLKSSSSTFESKKQKNRSGTTCLTYDTISKRHHISSAAGGRLGSLVLGADSEDRASRWHRVFEKTISSKSTSALPSNALIAKRPLACSHMLNESDIWIRSASWSPWKLVIGKQLWKLNYHAKKRVATVSNNANSSVVSEPVVLKIHDIADTDPETTLKLFLQCLDDTSLVEKLSEFSDIIHWMPQTSQEKGLPQLEFCLLRQWRCDPDGSMVLTLDSVEHEGCPQKGGRKKGKHSVVRGILHSVSLIVPDFDHRICVQEGDVNLNNDVFTRGKWIPQKQGGSGGKNGQENNFKGGNDLNIGGGGTYAPPTGFGGNGTGGFGSSDYAPNNNTGAGSGGGRMFDMDDAALIEAQAASVAAAAATAAASSALPPSCLVITSATVSWPGSKSSSKGSNLKYHNETKAAAQLLLYMSAKLSASLKCDRFCSEALQDQKDQERREEGTSIGDEMDHFHPMSPSSPRGSVGGRSRRASSVGEVDGSLVGMVDTTALSTTPPCSLPQHHWSTADLSSFVVRGPTFTEDKVKIPAGESMFDLIAIDLWKVDGPIPHIASHPMNRVNLAHKRGENTWIFVIQLQVPGPPHFTFVAYFVPKDPNSVHNTQTPFGRLAQPFFFGDDDEYRNDHFKLIPKVQEGNFIVRNAVGAKPTILGRKLTQNYFRGPNYFELDVDISSSAIAQRVVGVAYGYAKLLTVDMAFVLQGDSVDELPECPFGSVRMINLDFNAADFLPAPDKVAQHSAKTASKS